MKGDSRRIVVIDPQKIQYIWQCGSIYLDTIIYKTLLHWVRRLKERPI